MSKNIILIGIDGHGGSGKSTLAEYLSQHLNAEVIHIDDFTGIAAPDSWHKLIVEKVIQPIQRGANTLAYERAKWWPEHNPEPVTNQPVTRVMIIEGVGSLRTELRSYLDIKILVATPRDICIERGLIRDRGMGGKNDKQILAQWNQWLDWDDQYFSKHRPDKVADINVDGTQSYYSVTEYIDKRLATI